LCSRGQRSPLIVERGAGLGLRRNSACQPRSGQALPALGSPNLVDRRARRHGAQVGFPVLDWLARRLLYQAHKYVLLNILGLRTVADHPERGPENGMAVCDCKGVDIRFRCSVSGHGRGGI